MRPSGKQLTLQASYNSTTAVPPPPLPASRGARNRSRTSQIAGFVAAITWYFCARALAQGAASWLAQSFDLGDGEPLLAAVFLLFLLISGLAALRKIEGRRMPLRMALGLPRRRTAGEEWGTGAALGWGLAVLSVAAIALAGGLNVQIWSAPRAWEMFGLSLVTLLVATLAEALALYGYGFHRLIETFGPTRATLVLMLLAGAADSTMQTPSGTPDGVRLLVEMLAVLLLALSWFRTHGLWLGWGLHFAWAASTGILFGLPLRGRLDFSSVVDARTSGPVWLTGASFGPSAAVPSVALLLLAIPVLLRVTSDYAWAYTHAPLIPGGYDVTIPPPAAHVAMEQSALATAPVNPASLVQILPAPSRSPGPHTTPE